MEEVTNQQSEFNVENQKLAQLFFELGRTHHVVELEKSNLADLEVKCRNQNQKLLKIKVEMDKNGVAAVPDPAPEVAQ